MGELLPADTYTIYLLPLLLVVFLLLLLLFRRRATTGLTLSGVLSDIAYERVDGLVIPNVDEGEIQIDHLLLTAQGLLIIDIKDVTGSVFGSDKMQDWTVISNDRRFTFTNPQPALFDRIAAVRHIVRQVPVAGRILFLDGAEFTKGVPGLATTLQKLREEFGDSDKSAAKMKIETFRQHWEALNARAIRTTD
jgi:Nuclease-related domain